jgi:hypothetical protein
VKLDGDVIKRRIYERLDEALVPQGWRKDLEADESHKWGLVRENGAVRQEMSFGAYLAGGLAHVLRKDGTSEIVDREPKAQINVYLKFSSALIDDVLHKLLPDDTAALAVAYTDGARAHFFTSTQPLFPRARGLSGDWVTDAAQLDAWIDRFLAWYAADGRTAFDGCRDMPTLNRMLHTPWSLSQTRLGGLQGMVATLVLVHLCDDPKVPFMDWLGVVRRAQIERFRWRCERYAQFPKEFQEVPKEVAENAIVERLIERIRRRRAPNT